MGLSILCSKLYRAEYSSEIHYFPIDKPRLAAEVDISRTLDSVTSKFLTLEDVLHVSFYVTVIKSDSLYFSPKIFVCWVPYSFIFISLISE